jgi:thiol-disulfide isomerase/thioredoxin
MKKLVLFIFISFLTLILNGQEKTIIEGQILNYKGSNVLRYSLKDYYGGSANKTTKIDSTGRFIITVSGKDIQFFSLNYDQDTVGHTCRIIVEPGKNYVFVSKGYDRNDWKSNYSPIIYISVAKNDFISQSYRIDNGTMFYNLIDNGTMGHLYEHEWNMKEPDSLLMILQRKIKSGTDVLKSLRINNEISNEFYDIAKLNLEYTQAYRLAQTIRDEIEINISKKRDSLLTKKLLEIYPKIFSLYPVNKNISLEKHYCFYRYVDLYLNFLVDYSDGKYTPQIRRGAAHVEPQLESREFLNDKAYDIYNLMTTMSYMASYGPESVSLAKKLKNEQTNPDPEGINFINNVLLPTAELLERKSHEDFPARVIVLDKDSSISTFKQLVEIVGEHPFVIEFWGTWCIPCRYQLQFHKETEKFLDSLGIKLVYVAVQYGIPRETWQNVVKAGNLIGYNFIASDIFVQDFVTNVSPIKKFPRFYLFDHSGKLIDNDLPLPSEKTEFRTKICTYLKK